jgi:hypothetical protein
MARRFGRHLEHHKLVGPGREPALNTELTEFGGEGTHRVGCGLMRQVVNPATGNPQVPLRRLTSPRAIRSNRPCCLTWVAFFPASVPLGELNHSVGTGSSVQLTISFYLAVAECADCIEPILLSEPPICSGQRGYLHGASFRTCVKPLTEVRLLLCRGPIEREGIAKEEVRTQ